VNIRLGDGTTRRGQVLEVDGEKAVVQVTCFTHFLYNISILILMSILQKTLSFYIDVCE